MCGQMLVTDMVVPWELTPPLRGHAPAEVDLRWPKMGGKPSKGTKKDKRIKKNKGK